MLRLDINLLFTVINLLLLFVIIRVFLFKPIKKVMAKRQEEFDKQFTDAQSVTDKANELKKQYEDSLSGVEAEKAAVISEGRAKASAEYDRIVADAQVEAQKVLENARKAAEIEKDKSIKEAKEQIADLVVAATAKVVASGQGEEADRELYNQFLAKTGEEN